MILVIQQDLKSEGFKETISRLCRWFEVPRCTAYYKPCKAPLKVQERFEAPIKAMIDQDPSFGYRTVAGLLKFNKNKVQHIFQIRGWQVKQRPIGFRSRVHGRVTAPFLLRRDNGLVFTSRSYTRLVKSYGLRQEFITPHSHEQNGLVERVIRTIKEQRVVHRQRFETLQHASRVLGDWIGFYNQKRPHQALRMKTPNQIFEMFRLAACPEQKMMGHYTCAPRSNVPCALVRAFARLSLTKPLRPTTACKVLLAED